MFVALPLLVTGRLRLTRAAAPFVVVVAVAEVVGRGVYAFGARDGIAVAAVMSSQFGAIAAIVSVALFGEQLRRIQVVGIAVIAVGVAALAALQATWTRPSEALSGPDQAGGDASDPAAPYFDPTASGPGRKFVPASLPGPKAVLECLPASVETRIADGATSVSEIRIVVAKRRPLLDGATRPRSLVARRRGLRSASVRPLARPSHRLRPSV